MLPRILRTASFRLAAAYTGLFAASVLVLGAFVSWTTRSALEQQMNARIEAEVTALREEFRSGGVDALLRAVRERIRGARALDYAVDDATGKRLAGNLEARTHQIGWTEVESDGAKKDGEEGERIRVLSTRLDDGTWLAVGDDIDGPMEAITAALAGAFGLTVVLGIAGGLVLSGGFLRRVDAISRAAEAIVDGDLEQRIPGRGTQDDLDRLAHTLNRMLDRIAELMSGMRQVSSALAHELRTPLTRLRQHLERGLADASPAAKEEALHRAMAETESTLETFAALLRIAQVEAGTRRSGFREVDLGEVVENVLEAFTAPAEEQGKTLAGSVPAPSRIRGDRELLTQLLANLVENALRHTPPGTRVEVNAKPTPSGALLTVADSGPGVPAEERKRIFDRFHRLDPSTEGLGLGLSLVKAIADLHGAQLRAEDNGPGLRVVVEFA